MKALHSLLCLAITALILLPATASADRRDPFRQIAEDLKNRANKLEDRYKDYLKDTRRWKPRGQEKALWDAVEDFEDATDRLHDRAKKGDGRETARAAAEVQARAAGVSRLIHFARSHRVQREWRECERLVVMLSHYRRGPRHDWRRTRPDGRY